MLAVRTNTVPAEAAQTARDEVLGGSNGRPNQVFQLQNVPVLGDSLALEVDQGDGPVVWQRVDDLFEREDDVDVAALAREEARDTRRRGAAARAHEIVLRVCGGQAGPERGHPSKDSMLR